MSFTVPAVAPVKDDYTPETIVGRRLIDAMGPWMTLHLAWLCDAIGAEFEQVAGIVLGSGIDGDPNTDYQPGYGVLLDPSRGSGSELQYCGQFVGVTVPDGLSDTDARSLVLAEGGMNRGTLASVIAAAKRHLSGTQQVTLIERFGPKGPDGYWFTLIVRPSELISQADLILAVGAVKPGGVLMWLLVEDAFIWAAAIHTWADDQMTWAQAATQQP